MPTPPNNPGFLCIGAARAGTTWLYRHLKKHPQIWLPPLKELHYFDFQRPGAKNYYPVPGTRMRRMSWGWYGRHSYSLLRRLITFRTRPGWAFRYILGRRSDRWYQKLFRVDRLSGEITPGYMLLPRPVVEDVRKLNPSMKIILFLRNPVSRAWSSIRKQLGKKSIDAPDEAIYKLAESPNIVMRGDYGNAVRNWRGVFGERQVFIGFYDDLVSAPRDLLKNILKFLEVDAADDRVPADIDKVINSGPKRDLPDRLLPRLYAPYVEALKELEQLVGGPVGKWRAKAEEATKGVERS
jgi:hypothetical protein